MSILQKFIFEGLPVRGAVVHIDASWQELLARRRSNSETGPYPKAVEGILGQMSAAALLMQANIKFNGSLILQILGDGPLPLAVVEAQPNGQFRATATVTKALHVSEPSSDDAAFSLADWVDRAGQGRCAITLDPQDRLPGQTPYQGQVSLRRADGRSVETVAEMLEAYMQQSEQLDTCLVLAANAERAAGLLIQRLPGWGKGNLAAGDSTYDAQAEREHYERIALLARSLKPEELLSLDVESVLHRLFWQEPLARYAQDDQQLTPRFACRCSRERVARMIEQLGSQDAQDLIAERGVIEVACDFCGQQYHFDAIDARAVFESQGFAAPSSQRH